VNYTFKFLSYKAPIYPLYLIDTDQTLSETDTIKFLGLHLDSHLSWKSLTNVLVRKLSSVCYVMRKLSNILNIVTSRIVYFAYFQSLVNYGIIFWGSSSTMHNIFLMQKRIIRIMLGLGPRSSCRGAFRKFDILTVPSLYIYALMMFAVNNPDSFQSNSTIHCINMRQKNQLHLPMVKFSSIQEGVIYASIKIFNNLPPNLLKHYADRTAFRSELKKFIDKNAFYSIDEFLSSNHDVD
jgi:hypothetical protein